MSWDVQELAEGILEEFSRFSPYAESEIAQAVRALAKREEAAERRKEALRLRRASERRLVRVSCPHCGVPFEYTLPRTDGRIPVYCSLRCGGAVRKGRWLAKVPYNQLKLEGLT